VQRTPASESWKALNKQGLKGLTSRAALLRSSNRAMKVKCRSEIFERR